ncbi:hypothetical protein GIB67_011372 [Kingdonia uniflora]|uniref:Uncharacterized protein n=1 Tax=Kingdonia uniflora TaxID=39325 RepID=A0A7J7LCL3_9MAGN|nr:hypothetical protein GIB67_011372 [Kingdonia uniflora]
MLSFWTRRMMLECIGRTRTLRVSQGRRDPECPTRRSSGSTKSQWYALNAQCVAYKGIVAQERFRIAAEKQKKIRIQFVVAQLKIRSSSKDDYDKPSGSAMDESDDEEDI